jgi:hypothetical protein
MIVAALLLATRFQIQSNFWVNLHQRLQHESATLRDTITTTSDEDRAEWNRAVEAYRAHFGQRLPWVDPEIVALHDALSRTAENTTPSGIPDAVRDVLVRVAPVYRRDAWPADNRANRFWIAYAEPMLRNGEEELVREHERVYGTKWPEHVVIDIAPFAGPVGAFTTGDVKVTHTTISSLHPNYRGFLALEMMLHESSHGVFDEELVGDRAKKLGVEAPPNLWHAILFYTSGELTRRFLATRGIDDYKPVAYAAGVFKRGDNPRYVPLLETIWQQHIDGKLSLDDAINSMITHLAAKK